MFCICRQLYCRTRLSGPGIFRCGVNELVKETCTPYGPANNVRNETRRIQRSGTLKRLNNNRNEPSESIGDWRNRWSGMRTQGWGKSTTTLLIWTARRRRFSQLLRMRFRVHCPLVVGYYFIIAINIISASITRTYPRPVLCNGRCNVTVTTTLRKPWVWKFKVKLLYGGYESEKSFIVTGDRSRHQYHYSINSCYFLSSTSTADTIRLHNCKSYKCSNK